MASRDLTNQFVELRSAFLLRKRSASHRDGKGKRGFGGSGHADPAYKKLTAGGGNLHDLSLMEEGDSADGGGGGGIQLSSLSAGASAPAWVADVRAVEDVLAGVRRDMEDLQALHAARLGSVFGKDLEHMEARIERKTRDMTDQFRVAERLLQKVGAATRRSEGAATIGANIQRSLAKRLQEASLEFRQSQRKYLAEVRTQKSGGLAPGADTRFGIDLASPPQGEFFSSQQLAVVDDLTEMVQSRDQEISRIAQSIEELGTIFKELAVLVIDQGTILDRIDYNMEAVVEHTKTGIKQLERAEKSQKNARPLRCIVCLSTTIFILLVLLVLKHHRWR